MISKSKIKLIKSLEYRKYREQTGLFIAEGNKLVNDIINSDIQIDTLIAIPDFAKELKLSEKLEAPEIVTASSDEIKLASLLKNPQDAIALCRIPVYNLERVNPDESLIICLDGIQDPGNLGTIIRLADWFGISDIVCSHGSVDAFNPKVIQASMGSVCRVAVHYTDLVPFVKLFVGRMGNISGAFLLGENLFKSHFEQTGILVMGNEGRGISNDLASLIERKISIPSFSHQAQHAESLNVAVATAIICSEIRRRSI